jgi:putative membrane protein
MFSSIGNWGYTYSAHRKYGNGSGKEALDILDERYARGDLSREEWGRMKIEIAKS